MTYGHEKATYQHSTHGLAVHRRRDERIIEVPHDMGRPHAHPHGRILSSRVIDAQAREKGGGITLRFGYTKGLPAGTETAGGCRAIVGQGGMVDVVHDRQDAIGPDEPRRALLTHLAQHGGSAWQQRAAQLLSARGMDTWVAEEFVLHEDHHVMIKSNTQGAGATCTSARIRRCRGERRHRAAGHRLA
jgi:hypothetical protein